ncbi:hypothetical protein CC85DRAFT_154459 [Cutaneotrichosporon oleaginosum]|uniref:Uncharacterized protein n=1 Tax=Cutaneotrichosporon oleaginosum TaxID=879819 RepID=A0A0J0XW31_9TREE|nr:uncharacterized protein CC85DRAFT_154459 [Cutaneotrichosporon oleaginosum]KLT45281.1 hypothetical protein CC85DRAFT_154459 [Cutaneotrichosporon oleaginosum]TXT14890.1 hypothetical protein COLE_01083 [Cutaneotrichosporon oleaginosum]
MTAGDAGQSAVGRRRRRWGPAPLVGSGTADLAVLDGRAGMECKETSSLNQLIIETLVQASPTWPSAKINIISRALPGRPERKLPSSLVFSVDQVMRIGQIFREMHANHWDYLMSVDDSAYVLYELRERNHLIVGDAVARHDSNARASLPLLGVMVALMCDEPTGQALRASRFIESRSNRAETSIHGASAPNNNMGLDGIPGASLGQDSTTPSAAGDSLGSGAPVNWSCFNSVSYM